MIRTVKQPGAAGLRGLQCVAIHKNNQRYDATSGQFFDQLFQRFAAVIFQGGHTRPPQRRLRPQDQPVGQHFQVVRPQRLAAGQCDANAARAGFLRDHRLVGALFDVEGARRAGSFTPEWVLAHILHEVATHAGHLELTRDVLLSGSRDR